MRPTPDAGRENVFECFGCGKQAEDTDRRVRDRCGSTMRNIGAVRDL
jgi:hypothetical protein